MASISHPPSPSARRPTGSGIPVELPLTSSIAAEDSVSAAMSSNRKRLRSYPRVELGAKRARHDSGNNSERPRLPSNASIDGPSFATRIGRSPAMSRRQSGPMAFLPTITRKSSITSIIPPPPPQPIVSLSAKRHLSETRLVIQIKPSPSFDKRFGFPMAWSSKQELFYADHNSVQRQYPNKDKRRFLQKVNAAGMAIGIFGIHKRECLAIIDHEDKSLTVWRLKNGKRVYRFHHIKADKMTAIVWHESTISVGFASGMVEHFDVSGPKVKKLAQMDMDTLNILSGLVTCVAWNSEGTVFAAGDASGNVGVWKRDGERLVLGDMGAKSVGRRIRHDGAITTLTWFPSDPNRLLTGDSKGLIRIWSLNGHGSATDFSIARAQYGPSGLTDAERLEGNSVIQSVHISRQLPEVMIVYGSYASEHVVRETQHNSVSAYNLRDMSPLRKLTLYEKKEFARNFDDPSFCGSALSEDETKLALVIPELGEIRIWNAWGLAQPSS